MHLVVQCDTRQTGSAQKNTQEVHDWMPVAQAIVANTSEYHTPIGVHAAQVPCGPQRPPAAVATDSRPAAAAAGAAAGAAAAPRRSASSSFSMDR